MMRAAWTLPANAPAPLCALAVLLGLSPACVLDDDGQAPVVEAIVPSRSHNAAPTAVTITGRGFFLDYSVDVSDGAQTRVNSGFQAHLGSIALTDVTWVDSNTLQATVPQELTPDVYDVQITTPSGKTGVLPGAFEVVAYVPLLIASVTPAVGVAGRGADIVIDGSGFDDTLAVSLGETPVAVRSVTATQIKALVPTSLEPGRYAMHARRGDGEAADLADAFTVARQADLHATVKTSPGTCLVGESVVLGVDVVNQGEAVARNVRASTPTWTGDGAISIEPIAVAPVDVVSQGKARFEWRVLTSFPGSVFFSASASATEEQTGEMVRSAVAVMATPLRIAAQNTLGLVVSTTEQQMSVGGLVHVQGTVTNEGTDTAREIAATIAASEPDAVQIQRTRMVPQTLAVGETASFEWVFALLEARPVIFTVRGQGIDEATGAPVASAASVSDTVTGLEPASLQLESLQLAPAAVTIGQQLTLTYVVRNGGQSAARDVRPVPPVATAGSFVLVGESSPPTVVLAAGAQAALQWSVQATAPGFLQFLGNVGGLDDLSGLPIVSAAMDTSSATVARGAMLAATLVAEPAAVTEGQSITVFMDVVNTGDVMARQVRPTPLVLSSSAVATIVSGPLPAEVSSLSPGDAVRFSWSLADTAADSTGLFAASAAATGRDPSTDRAIASAPCSTPGVLVQSPPRLALEVVAPSTVVLGQQGVLVTVVARNEGNATAHLTPGGALLSITPQNAGHRITRTDQVDAIPGGEQRVLSFAVDIDAAASVGTNSLDASVGATDANTGADVSVPFGSATTTPATFQVVAGGGAAELRVELGIAGPVGALEGIVSTGQAFELTATVVNVGTCNVEQGGRVVFDLDGSGATAATSLERSFVIGQPLRLTLTAAATPTTGSVTARLDQVPTDMCTASPATVSRGEASVSISTVARAALSLTAWFPASDPDDAITVSTGQTFVVRVQVQNQGTAAVTGPAELTLALGTSGVSLLTPASTLQTFTPGVPVTYTLTASAASTGQTSLWADLNTVPLDENTGAPAFVQQPSATLTLTTQGPAHLTVTDFSLAQPAVAAGATFFVSMSVTNSGEAAATDVVPDPLSTDGVAVTQVEGPSAVSIEGGATEVFVWRYLAPADSAGEVVFSGRAAGRDANSGVSVVSQTSSTDPITISAGEIALDEVQVGAAEDAPTVTSASVGAAPAQLYLAFVTVGSPCDVLGVEGLGLTWARLAATQGADAQTQLEVWTAYGSPAGADAVSATLSNAPKSAVIVVARYVGARSVSPIGSVCTANSLGPSASCGSATGGDDESDSWSVPLTPTGSSSLLVAAVAMGNRDNEPGPGFVERIEVHPSSLGWTTGLAVQDRKLPDANATVADGTLDEPAAWAAVAIEVQGVVP